jgi:MYXO-CTERM domain-containing protein
MRALLIRALIAVAGAATAANAQPLGTATYFLKFSNGSNIIALGPGQSTTVSVYVSFEPGIGATIGSAPPLQGPVLGLHNGSFSISGFASGGFFGVFSVPAPGTTHPALIAPYNFLPGVLTHQGTSVGMSHNGVIWGMGFQFTPVHPLPANPAKVWEGVFTSITGGHPMIFSITGLGSTGILTSSGPVFAGNIPWIATFASDPGQGGLIVPAPAGLALLGLGGLVGFRRRRSGLDRPTPLPRCA